MDALNRSSLVIRMPAEIQAALVEAQNTIRRKAGADLVRWTPANELLLTLVSLGEISPSQIAQVSASVGGIVGRYAAPQVTLEALGGSPNNLQPRFLWIGMAGDVAPLQQLAGELDKVAGSIVYGHEGRPLQAHVPIGRIKQESESNRSALGRAIRVAGVGMVGSFQATSVELVRAAATTAGPTILTVQTFPFA